jgi:hypothetical protein
MASHPYEYKVLMEYISPEEKGKYPHFGHIEDQAGFCKTMEEVFKHLPEAIPPGWEVVSHDITVSRNTVMVTVLIKHRFQAPKNKRV